MKEEEVEKISLPIPIGCSTARPVSIPWGSLRHPTMVLPPYQNYEEAEIYMNDPIEIYVFDEWFPIEDGCVKIPIEKVMKELA